MPQKKWKIKKHLGLVIGPFSTSEVRGQIRLGSISESDLICEENSKEWKQIGKDKKFFNDFMIALEGDRSGEGSGSEGSYSSSASGAGSINSVNSEALNKEEQDVEIEKGSAKVVSSFNEEEEIRHQEALAKQEEKKLLKLEKKKEHQQLIENKLKEQKRKKDWEEKERSRKFGNFLATFLQIGLVCILGYVVYEYLNTKKEKPKGGNIRLLSPYIGPVKNLPNADSLFGRALSNFQLDTYMYYTQSQNDLVTIIQSQPTNSRALELLCMVYRELWPFSFQDSLDIETIKKIALYTRNMDPTSEAAQTCDLVFLSLTGKYRQMYDLTQKVLRVYPEHTFNLEVLADYYSAKKKYEDAAFYYNNAAASWSGNRPWLKLLVREGQERAKIRGVNQKENITHALKLFRKVIDLNPYHASAKILAGVLEFENFNQIEKAELLINDGLKSNLKLSKFVESKAYYTLARMYKNSGKQLLALKYAQKAYSIDFSNVEIKNLALQLGGAAEMQNIKLQNRDLLYTGDQYVKSGDCFAAQAEYKVAFEVNPKSGLAAKKAAECLWELNQSQEAISWLKKSIKADPTLIGSYILLADYFSQRFDFMSASRILNKSASIAPGNYEVMYGLGLMELRRTNYDGAVRYAEEAMKLYDSDAKVGILLADSYFYVGDFNAAYETIIQVNELEPQNILANTIKAKILGELRGVEVGLSFIEKLISNNDKIVEYKIAKTELLILEERYKLAEQELWDAVEDAPNNKKAFLLLGEVLQKLNRIEDAQEIYLRSAVLDPSDAYPLFLSGVMHLENNNTSLAIKYFNRVLSINSQYPKAYYNIGLAYMRLKKYEDALKAAEKEKNYNPDLAEPYILIADAYAKMGLFEQCTEEYQKVVKRMEPTSDIYVDAAYCYRRLGALESAQSMINKAASKESANALIYKEQGAILEVKEDFARSAEAYDKYLTLDPGADDRAYISSKIKRFRNK